MQEDKIILPDDFEPDSTCGNCGAENISGQTLSLTHLKVPPLRRMHVFFCRPCLVEAARGIDDAIFKYLRSEEIKGGSADS